MIGSFKQYLVEENKIVVFSFGRMNPPTIGHEKLLDAMAKTAGKNPYRMYLSQSQDAKKNPLTYKDKLKIARKMFPKHARNILKSDKLKNVFQVATSLYDEGYRNVTMVVGSDRIREFDILLNKYNGKKGAHGFYNFMDIKVVSAGDRDPDAEGAAGMSASKMRAAASDNDFTKFSQGIPKAVSNAESKKIFNMVRKGMGLKEQTEFKRHIQLEPVSDVREAYVDGSLYSIGDQVIIKENDEIGVVVQCASNYLIIEQQDGKNVRKWLDAVEHIEEKVSPSQITSLERFADKLLNKYGIDVAFTRHFADRMNDARNNPDIKIAELQKFFKKIHKAKGNKIKSIEDMQAVLKDLPTDLNMPVVIRPKGDNDIEITMKTIMRKKDFKTPNSIIKYESTNESLWAKTKPSKHTLRFKQMFGESEAQKLAKTRIEREKAADAKRHDRMLDRARLKDAKTKNKETE